MKRTLRHLIAIVCPVALLAGNVFSQNLPSPKREFRGAWIATVANIDFPPTDKTSQEGFMNEWTKMLDMYRDAGFNAVLTQVRPAGDAFYRSKIAPWSKYLTGTQGVEPKFDFDPLVFMVQETHKRNMEFHAWLNPYRAATDTVTTKLAGTHPYKYFPKWFLRYGGRLYFNPAMPEVRNYITEVVMEIIMEYDVDGIHFDDYFYPYPSAGETFPDSEDFAKYGYGFYNIDDWRRNNVDLLIAQVSGMIKAFAPHVKFGISPFGVWRNKEKDPVLGSATRAGVNCYDDLYADVRGWLEKGWIDYVAPQLYWNIGFQVADYQVLVDWWRNNTFNRHLYIGHAAYKVNNNPEEAWKKPGEIPKQIRLNRNTLGVHGSIFYNTVSLRTNPLGVMDSLRIRYYAKPALLPEMAFKELPRPKAPTLGKPKYKNSVLLLPCSLSSGEAAASYLVVYRFEDRLPGDYNNPESILKLVRLNGYSTITIEDNTAVEGKTYCYVVSAVNRAHTESDLSDWRTIEVRSKGRIRLLKKDK
jgi:uncharacterized lipoprotein YddW (UPF0748 family)